MYRYEIIVYWSEQDNAFIAEVPESLGYMADDSSYEEVMKMCRLSSVRGLKQQPNEEEIYLNLRASLCIHTSKMQLERHRSATKIVIRCLWLMTCIR